MEMELLQASLARGYISSNKKALAMRQQDEHRVTCAVGGMLNQLRSHSITRHVYLEPSIVHVELRNPLLIPMHLSDMILHCQHRDSMLRSEEKETETSANTSMIEGRLVEGTEDMFDFDTFELQKIASLTLDPLETSTVSMLLANLFL